MFADQKTARVYLEKNLWPEGPKCPVCGLCERITTRKDGSIAATSASRTLRCAQGRYSSGHIPLHKWIYAMYLLVTARKGISSLQLAKEIGISQKSAWFMLHRSGRRAGQTSRSFAGSSKSTSVSSAGSKPISTSIRSSRWVAALSARRPFLGCASVMDERSRRRSRAQTRKQFKPLFINTSKSDRYCIPTEMAVVRVTVSGIRLGTHRRP